MAVLHKNPNPLSEKTVEGESFEVETCISEMGLADIGSDIPIDAARMERIKARDDDPQFVVVEIESCAKAGGTSQAEWGLEAIRSIAEQVNKKRPVGYAGHIPDSENHTAFPAVQAVWLGARVVEKGTRSIARVKGYLMPKAEMRDYLELEAVDGVSVRGDATLSRKPEGGWRVKEFVLESIDFARKGKSGMPTRIVALTSEMEGGISVEPKDIAAIDESELRQHNPLLVKKIEEDASAELTTKVSEMETAATVVEPKVLAFDEICEKLGIKADENPVERVVQLLESVEGAAKAQIKGLVDKAIEKVAGKSERAQNVVRRLVGEQIEAEFADVDLDDAKAAEEIQKKVSEMVEADEDVKAVVAEMVTTPSRGGGAHLGSRSHQSETETLGGEERSRTGKLNFGKKKA